MRDCVGKRAQMVSATRLNRGGETSEATARLIAIRANIIETR
jgi:hypothetical protein